MTNSQYDSVKVKEKLRQALDEWESDRPLTPEQKHDIVFHITDCLSDFRKLADFCESPENYSSEEVSNLLVSILCHVPEHFVAAAKLLLNQPIEDIFEVGVFSEDSKD